MIEHLTKDTFIEKIFDFENIDVTFPRLNHWKFKGSIPCIIDFYADWCGPCKVLSPILEELAEEYKGKINIYKIDTEDEQDLSMLFNIRSIPALLFISMYGEPEMSVGAPPKSTLKTKIEKLIPKN